MADALKRCAGPVSLGAAAATVYTVPALTQCALRSVHVANETGTAAVFTMSIGTDGAGKRLWAAVSIPANSSFDWSGTIVLNAGEILQAYSGTASALTLTASGVEAS